GQARVEAARGEEGFATDGQVETARRIVPRPPAEVRGLGAEVVGCEVGCEGCVPPAGQRAGEAEPYPPAGAGDARIRERGEERGEPAVGGERVVVDEGDHLAAGGAGAGVAGARRDGDGLGDGGELAMGRERAVHLGRDAGRVYDDTTPIRP